MEYGIDKTGRSTHHASANKLTYYMCPHCLEEVIIRKGLNACFYHRPIYDRTPLQRTCPEYHENSSYSKVNDNLDILYIQNGGIPLYLCNLDRKFKLKAYFPTVSDKAYDKLKQIGAKIHVNTKAHSDIDRKIYNINNINFYPVNTIEKWIEIDCIPSIDNKEINQKWLWGIRGVDIERDIYHSNKDGGYRVALKANISVGTRYRVMFDRMPSEIDGMVFNHIGEISLKDKTANKVINIYEMTIDVPTEKAREFIEGKGYRLAEKQNELIPLWPPGVFKGNEITFNSSKALFLHLNNTKKERVYYTSHGSMIDITKTRGDTNVIIIQINGSRSITISDLDTEKFNSEIKYNIIYNPYLVRKKDLAKHIIIKDSNGLEISLSEQNKELPVDRKLYIESNLQFCATVNNKDYVISSSEICFEDIDYPWNLIINSRGYGNTNYQYLNEDKKIKSNDLLDWDKLYLILNRCAIPTTRVNNKHLKMLYLLSLNVSDRNLLLYKMISTWIKTNSIPISAIKYVDEILESLGGTIIEKEYKAIK